MHTSPPRDESLCHFIIPNLLRCSLRFARRGDFASPSPGTLSVAAILHRHPGGTDHISLEGEIEWQKSVPRSCPVNLRLWAPRPVGPGDCGPGRQPWENFGPSPPLGRGWSERSGDVRGMLEVPACANSSRSAGRPITWLLPAGAVRFSAFEHRRKRHRRPALVLLRAWSYRAEGPRRVRTGRA